MLTDVDSLCLCNSLSNFGIDKVADKKHAVVSVTSFICRGSVTGSAFIVSPLTSIHALCLMMSSRSSHLLNLPRGVVMLEQARTAFCLLI